ncbi:2-oxoisovalerate dehydrogenase subunit alpha mitochondrial precursor [Didymella exigua CBS 183.55]|uniref:2-oxoisovalerate dehydrogenase subunit alpha n=1 Tax=Didymella exigua CBS 183.55 TaxID=1150837 RepID=A0A6A5RNI3_9PLEO|nr:2-oxoisovalerate dehydrogenase subunit alpha mitochondrial precursor [Didymella exigua CBS 183.55]KAF1929965.1 2-oxoisovalerate dehydrogenase subunit alpha mitochondrial precursor [Didymella exigua CBS 183.55]
MSFRYSARRLRAQRLRATPNASRAVSTPWPCRGVASTANAEKVLFPGALNSEFTNTLSFLRPSKSKDAIPTYRCLNQYGDIIDESVGADTTDEEALQLYKNMVTLSIMDLLMFEAQRQGRLSFYMVSAGEEGISIGSASALHPSDVIFTQYRESGVYLQRGFTLAQFMNQLFANSSDHGLGRNMPVHYGSKELNIHTISSTLATQIPHAAGAAYALKLQNQGTVGRIGAPASGEQEVERVAVCFFGEGAASEGDFHSALNIAATRQVPCIFICRNNGYAISTPTSDQYRGDGIASRGAGYGIDTLRVDGNDIFAVRRAVKEARRLALEDGGRPVLVECMAYRVGHHSTSDDSFAYRARVEVEDWKRRDNPLTRLRKWLEGRALWDDAREKELRAGTRKDVLRAFETAEKQKKPNIKNAFTDVWEGVTEEQRAHVAEMADILKRYPKEYDLDGHEGGAGGLDELLQKK